MDDDTPEKRRAPVALIISIITAVTAVAAITVAFAAGLFRFSSSSGSGNSDSDGGADDSGDLGAPGAGESADPPENNDPAEAEGDDAAGDGSVEGCEEDIACQDSGSCDGPSCDAPTCDSGSAPACDSGGAARMGGNGASCGLEETCDNAVDETCASIASNTCSTEGMACDSSLSLGSVASAGVSAMSVLPLVAVDRLAPKRYIRKRTRVSMPARCGLVAISGYRRWVSPRTRTRCRYVPSCSAYGRSTITSYGLATGSRLALKRIRRCTRSVPMGTQDPPP